MTWGEVKTAALQKMFLAASDPYVKNSTTSDYLSMMPQAANEGLLRLATVGRYITKSAIVNITVGVNNTLPNDVYEVIQSAVMRDGEYYTDFEIMPDGKIKANEDCTITVPYYAYPQKITKDTPDNTNIEMDADGIVLLPLYIASELYKEDDISMSTVWRNEFEVGLSSGRRYAQVIGGVVI